MISKARVGYYTHLPYSTERDAIRMASKADEAYLLDLQRIIEGHKSLIAQLEATYKEVEDRIKLRNPLVAPHRYLPNEILGHIFSLVEFDPYRYFPSRLKLPPRSSHVSPQEWVSRCPFNVSHVCRHWREVSLATPALWSWLVVDAQKKNPDQMMKHWFECSKAAPMDVTIWREKLQRTVASPIKEFMLLVSITTGSHMHQLKRLRVCCQTRLDFTGWSTGIPLAGQDAPVIFRALASMTNYAGELPKILVVDSMDAELKEISGMSGELTPPPFPIFLLKTLASLHVRGFLVSKSTFPIIPTCLTSLKLDGLASVRDNAVVRLPFHHLLSSLPQLIRLRLGGDYAALSAGSDDSLHLKHSISLPRLERLTVIGCPCTTHISLLVAPNLKAFKLKGDCHALRFYLNWKRIRRFVSEFLEKSGDNIAKFVLDRVGQDVQWDVLMAWWEQMGNLEHLVIRQSEVTYVPIDLRDKERWSFPPAPAALEWRLREAY